MIIQNQDCRYIELPKKMDVRGSMTYLEADDHIPFPIRRIRLFQGGHGIQSITGGYTQNHSVVVVLRGELEIHVDDGLSTNIYSLVRPNHALLIPSGFWFRTGVSDVAVIGLIIHSEELNDGDEMHTYDAFLKYRKFKHE